MKKQNRKLPDDRRITYGNQKEISPKTKKLVFSLVLNSLLLLLVYYAAMSLNIPVLSFIVMMSYMLIFGGFLVAYIAYNRAFTRKNITPDMLPDTWSAEKKEEYIADGKRRAEKSKWMLSVIIPFLITIMADALYLFVWEGMLKDLIVGFGLTVIIRFMGA